MATLKRMSIGGIRSFGADEADIQFITFDKPFTLILGRNGCGKTTIIEALKYACTGSMPTGQGASFVRDPKLDRRSETRAQVKLNFTSCHGKESTVSRSLQCTQKLKTLQCKTLDTTTSVKDNNGQVTQMSSRHSNIDELMAQLLGVSKPILNYVIFCHQEDSYWPLDEGKRLKERFDEIFDSTKYNKCVNEIRRLRKEKLVDIKTAKEGKKYLEADVALVHQKRRELEGVLKRFDDNKEKIEVLEKDISDCKDEYNMWHQRYEDYRKIEKERDAVKVQLDKFRNEQVTLKRMITVEFTGTEDELRVAIEEFNNQLHAKEAALQRLKQNQEQVNALETKTQRQISDVQNQIGKLEADQRHEENAKQERNVKLSNLAKSFGLPALEKQATEAEVDELISKIKKELLNLSSSIAALKLKQEKEQNDLQEDINRCREVKTKLEAEISMKQESISSTDDEMRKLSNKVNEVNLHRARKQKIDDDLIKCRQDHEKAVNAEDSHGLSTQIENLKEACRTLDDRQRHLRTEVNQLLEHQEIQKDIQKSEQKHNERLTDVRKLRSRNFDFISNHLKASSDDSIKHDLEEMIQRKRKELDRLKTQLAEKNREVSSLTEERKFKRDQLIRKQDELSKNSESMKTELRGFKGLDDALKTLENEIEDVQVNRGVIDSSRFMYSRFITQMKTAKPCCPLCNRDFEEERYATDLIDDLTQRMAEMPSNIEELSGKLKNLKDRHYKLLQLKPVQKSNENLENEIPQLQQEVASLDARLDSAHEEIALLEGSLQGPQEQLKKAEAIQNDIFELDRCHKESKQLARQIDQMKRDHPQSASSRSLDAALAEQQVVQDELSARRAEKDDAEERQRVYVRRINDLDQKINNLVAQQLQIKQLVQQEESLKERLTELSTLKDVLYAELEELKCSLTPAIENKSKSEEALDVARVQHKRLLLEKEREKGEREKEMNGVAHLQKSVMNFKYQNITEALQEHKLKLEKLMKRTDELKEQRDKLLEQSKELHQALDGHSQKKKELEENLNLMHVAVKISSEKEKLEQVEKKLGKSNLREIGNKCRDIDTQLSDLNKQINEYKGTLQELEKNIDSRRRELNENRFKNAETKFKEKLIEVEVALEVEKDLQKYYCALDHAMTHYHKDRMNNINKYVRELWRLIYQGNDIDYIEIKTDDGAGTATNDTDKKKNYNYRVVQVKNGTEIEMRSRCSAGQKVLACLIIRMALAETFSTNCGILTLDEPTTNLDKVNIASLCQAITDVVSDHEGRKTFQLVVITHDREFLSAMSGLDMFTHYWEVTRNNQSKSQVRRREVQKY